MELISVIVPVYKVEKYLEKCVKSIQNQTYTNLEILLINDGSPDNCGKICDKLAEEDPRIKVIHKTNGGLSSARNEGIKESHGKYICFVDSDDYIHEKYCEILYKALIETNSDISVVNYKETREENVPITNTSEIFGNIADKKTTVYEGIEIIKEILNRKTFKNIPWNKLYKSEIIKNHPFREGTNFEDIYFTFELLTDINKIVFTNEEYYYYIRRGDSIANTPSEKNLNDFLDAVLYRFYEIKDKYPEVNNYNYYALLDAIISISMKYNLIGRSIDTVNKKSEIIFNELCEYSNKNEEKFLTLLNDFQKSCLYNIKDNKTLFYSFLKEYQKIK